jgi:hypothetical protein
MSKVANYTSPSYPFSSPIAPISAVSTVTFNCRVCSLKSSENGFYITSTILGSRDVIEEYVAARIWPLSHGWSPSEIICLDVYWASQKVPFPQLHL